MGPAQPALPTPSSAARAVADRTGCRAGFAGGSPPGWPAAFRLTSHPTCRCGCSTPTLAAAQEHALLLHAFDAATACLVACLICAHARVAAPPACRLILAKAREHQPASTARVWMKSAMVEREAGDAKAERGLLQVGRPPATAPCRHHRYMPAGAHLHQPARCGRERSGLQATAVALGCHAAADAPAMPLCCCRRASDASHTSGRCTSCWVSWRSG